MRNAIAVLVATLVLVSITRTLGHGADTVTLVGNHPPDAETMAPVGNADPSQPLSMEIRFAVRNEAELNQLLAEQQNPKSPNYHRWLATGEYDRRFGPRQADIDTVAKWLKSEGFTVQSTADGYIRFSGTVAQAQRTFATRIARFGDGSTYANVNDPAIPARFAGVVGNILGLDNMTHAVPAAPRPMSIKPRAPFSSEGGKSRQSRSSSPYAPQALVSGAGVAFGPQDIRTFYDETVGSGHDGSGGCIAIVGISDFLDDALTAFQNQFMPNDPGFNVSRVLHGTNPGKTGEGEDEAEVDLEWSHAVAPGAAQKFHLGKNLVDDLSGAVDDSCDIISISFAFCGPPSGYTGPVHRLMLKAASLGESVFVSSGDQGAAGYPTVHCKTNARRNVSELAADPNVTAVGGTQFTPTYDGNDNDVGYSNNEQVWNDVGASGGGASQVYGKPAYQSGPGVPMDGRRDVPDVALIASPESPGVFWGHDSFGSGEIDCCIGGTSVSTPIWAGFTRLLAQMQGVRLGPMNPLIYQLANQQFGTQGGASGFHDISVGNNNFDGVTGFNAGPSYDQATGWGTVDFNVFAAAAIAQPRPTPGRLTVPKAVSFGSRKVGASSAQRTIKLTNPARNNLFAQITADATLLNGTDFSIASSGCIAGAIVPVGKSCGVAVIFNPHSASKTPLTDVLSFIDNASNSRQQVSLTGIGK